MGSDLDDTAPRAHAPGAPQAPPPAPPSVPPPALVEPPAPTAVPTSQLPPLPPLPPEVWAAAFPPEPPPPPPPRIRMADGVAVGLDLTIYLGRSPSVPRVAIDRKVRLVAVRSPDKLVSATHLELRRSGDLVVATDMFSTNGSIVTVPGSPPRTLLRGESAVLTMGSRVDLGDGNVVELIPPDLVPPDLAPPRTGPETP